MGVIFVAINRTLTRCAQLTSCDSASCCSRPCKWKTHTHTRHYCILAQCQLVCVGGYSLPSSVNIYGALHAYEWGSVVYNCSQAAARVAWEQFWQRRWSWHLNRCRGSGATHIAVARSPGDLQSSCDCKRQCVNIVPIHPDADESFSQALTQPLFPSSLPFFDFWLI